MHSLRYSYRLLNCAISTGFTTTIAVALFWHLSLWLTIVQAQSPTGLLEQSDCLANLTHGTERGSFQIFCGTITVPEFHADPGERTIRLPVIVLRNREADRASDPLFLLQGGPGGSTIDTYAQAVFYGVAFAGMKRDIVLFDQRGTKNADPSLDCAPEDIALAEQTIEQPLSAAEELSYSKEAFADCHARLEGQGINFAAFNSLENAADIEVIRQVLGYGAINVYGVSYGTLLALHYMRDFPNSIRSVILDAVVPTQIAFIAQIAHSGDRAFNELFAACAADSECNSAYPNLEQTFYELVAELEENPMHVPVADPETGKIYRAFYDGDQLLSMFFGALYADENIPILPLIIDITKKGKTRYLSANLASRAFGRSLATGMYNAVLCTEDVTMLSALVGTEGVHPSFHANRQLLLDELIADCETLMLPPLPSVVNAPVKSNQPTLILNGQFDPITPPAFGALAAESLPNSYSVTFPAIGHGAALSGECPQWIIYQFLERPNRPPDAGCIDALPPLNFVTHGEVIYSGVPNEVRFALTQVMEGRNVFLAFWRITLMAGCTLLLLSAWIVWPLAYLIKRRRERKAERVPEARVQDTSAESVFPSLSEIDALPNFGRTPSHSTPKEALVQPAWPLTWAGWILFFCGLSMFLFLVGLAVAIYFEFSVTTDLISVGVPRMFAPVFVLPSLILMLAIAMVIISILSWWRRHNWLLWRRIYFAALTVAAIVYTSVLFSFGLVTSIYLS
ncbi:MAG: alpha/beta fold hydrolase [Chloroflexota bacterium]